MKKQIYLHIPEPCHEDWNAMTPVQQGRFCKSCSKAVVDFSNMSDKQILEVLSKAAGSTCGRFKNEQLERPIMKEVTPMLKPYKFFLSAFIPAMITSAAGNAQTKLQGKVAAIHKPVCTTTIGDTVVSSHIVKGEVAQTAADKKIRGMVTDENNNRIAHASVILKGTNIGTATDVNGEFQITVPANQKHVVLQASSVGYEMKELKIEANSATSIKFKMTSAYMVTAGLVVSSDIDYYAPPPAKINIPARVVNEQGEPVPYVTIKFQRKNIVADSNGAFSIHVRENKKHVEIIASAAGYVTSTTLINAKENGADTIVLKLKSNVVLKEVVVVSNPDTKNQFSYGGLVRYTKFTGVTILDTTRNFLQKLVGAAMFKVYPNPISEQETLTLTFKKGGAYFVQLFDNSGKLFLSKSFSAIDAKQSLSLSLPAQLFAGTYYIKAINSASQKQFVQKVIVR